MAKIKSLKPHIYDHRNTTCFNLKHDCKKNDKYVSAFKRKKNNKFPASHLNEKSFKVHFHDNGKTYITGDLSRIILQ